MADLLFGRVARVSPREKMTQFVVIGKSLDREEFTAGLASCMIFDAYVSGSANLLASVPA